MYLQYWLSSIGGTYHCRKQLFDFICAYFLPPDFFSNMLRALAGEAFTGADFFGAGDFAEGFALAGPGAAGEGLAAEEAGFAPAAGFAPDADPAG